MRKYEQLRNERMERIALTKLSKTLKKKIETTMIGSLSSFEKYFSDLLEENSEIMNLYQMARSEILDKGNHQLRNIDSELENYVIKEKLHKYEFKNLTRED